MKCKYSEKCKETQKIALSTTRWEVYTGPALAWAGVALSSSGVEGPFCLVSELESLHGTVRLALSSSGVEAPLAASSAVATADSVLERVVAEIRGWRRKQG